METRRLCSVWRSEARQRNDCFNTVYILSSWAQTVPQIKSYSTLFLQQKQNRRCLFWTSSKHFGYDWLYSSNNTSVSSLLKYDRAHARDRNHSTVETTTGAVTDWNVFTFPTRSMMSSSQRSLWMALPIFSSCSRRASSMGRQAATL